MLKTKSHLAKRFFSGLYAVVGSFSVGRNDQAYLDTLASSGGPDSCGNKKIGVYCYSPSLQSGGGPDAGDIAGSLITFSITILVFLVILKLFTSFRSRLKQFGRRTWIKTQGARETAWATMQITLRHVKTISKTTGFTSYLCTLRLRCQDGADRICEHPRLQRLDAWDAKQLRKLKVTLNHLSRSAPPIRFMSLLNFARLTRQIYQFQTGHPPPSTWYSRLLTLFRWMIGFIFFCVYINYFAIFLDHLVYYAVQDLYNPTWNFGQVVSLSVWFPPIAEFIYLEIRGMRKGHRYRLNSRDYVVVRASHQVSGPSDDEEDYDDDDLEGTPFAHSTDTGSDLLHRRDRSSQREMTTLRRPLYDLTEGVNVEEKNHEPTINRVPAERSISTSSDLLQSEVQEMKEEEEHSQEHKDDEEDSDERWRLPEPDLPSRAITLTTRRYDEI